MGTAWEADSPEEWSDREAWRGGLHADASELVDFDVDTWRGEGEAGTVWAEPAAPPVVEEEDWPEELAGPEYWLFKKYGC